jgi:uncharacterized coiled-coil DUF342 family protein
MPEDPEQFAELLAAAVTEVARDIPAVSYEVRDAASQARKALDEVTRQIQALRDHRSNLDEKLRAHDDSSRTLSVCRHRHSLLRAS